MYLLAHSTSDVGSSRERQYSEGRRRISSKEGARMTTHHPIAIIGGGLGGLTTARVLHTRDIASAIFELEPGRATRVQGGMLDIHENNGQQAVHAADLWEPFTKIIHPGGEATRVLDEQATVLLDEHDDGELRRPEVDRGQLRDLLIDSLPDGTIRWGNKATAIRPTQTTEGRGRYEIDFANGTTITTDLLIGADGAWSRVRPLLTDALPAYTGISFVEVDLFDADAHHPAEAAAMGDGMLFALHGEAGILGHRETDGSLHVYLGLRVDEHWVDTIDWDDTPTAKREVLARLDGWDDALRGMIANADTALTPRLINALPVGLSWPRVAGVTLLGDAAHLMSPFAGEGANLALYDGARLATALADHPGDTEAALTVYESELFPRSAESAGESADGLEILFRDDSPRGLVEMFQGLGVQEAP
jgi:2-polyprenyl-6-methoxyphenol hydroxylase-like FAD-dependent oxidoreductase